MEMRGRRSGLVNIVGRNVEDLTRSFEGNNNHFFIFHKIWIDVLRVFSHEIGLIVGVVHEVGEIDVVLNVLLLLGDLRIENEGDL